LDLETGEATTVRLPKPAASDTPVLQSHYAGPDGWPAVWAIQADGNGLVKLIDGTYLDVFW
jgi:hypothetical protein